MEKHELKQITKINKALSDENRIRIIFMLKHSSSLCVCEITEIIGLAQPTISSHLKLLENAGLIESYKSGLWVNYNISKNLDPFSIEFIEALYKNLKDDGQMKSDLEKLKKVDRNSICRKRNC